MYRLFDNMGYPLRYRFSTWFEADSFRRAMGRPDWTIGL